MRNGGVLLAGSVFQMAWQATESDAALISMNAAWRGLWNSWCSSARRQSARIASAVDLHKVNADCLGRLCRASSGCNLARKTCTKNFPDTDFWKLFYFSDNSTAWITLITVSWSWRACTQHHVNPELNWNWTELNWTDRSDIGRLGIGWSDCRPPRTWAICLLNVCYVDAVKSIHSLSVIRCLKLSNSNINNTPSFAYSNFLMLRVSLDYNQSLILT